LTVFQMRRDGARDVRLGGSGRGDQNEFCSSHRHCDVRSGGCDGRVAHAIQVAYSDYATFENRRKRRRVSTPEPDLVALLAQVGGRSVRTVAASQNRNPHADSPSIR
jgi:hypothetical protein